MTPEQELLFYRTILLDESKSPEERKNAQMRIMEILEIKEKESDGEYPGNDYYKEVNSR